MEQCIAIGKGWNLISFPYDPVAPKVTDIFGGTSVRHVLGYRNGEWATVDFDEDGLSQGTLTKISGGYGYWVKASADETILVQMEDTAQARVVKGWNLLGVIGEEKRDADVYLDALDWSVARTLELPVENVDDDGSWHEIQRGEHGTLHPHKGYWVWSDSKATLPADSTDEEAAFESIPLRMHPRVFAALGADLVTNDIVAVIELVKNSYDAFAQNVSIDFGVSEYDVPYLEIKDDGIGMNKNTITDAWCTVATPYKEAHTVATKGNRVRRVVGSKGLGRLSAARLGNHLVMLTQAAGSPCWEVTADWSEISSGDDIATSTVTLRERSEHSPFAESGTILRISELKEHWDEKRIQELAENLSRLISPFATREQFKIVIAGTNDDGPVDIEAPRFLSEPKYSISGNVDATGNIIGAYRFAPIWGNSTPRTAEMNLAWPQVYDAAKKDWKFIHSEESAVCGPFSFEIRAWDIDGEGTTEISDKYGIQKNLVRTSIRTHKGISVYRDGVLALPKSEGARDWLGLDLRRVSQVGRRLSTSQLVGYVSISAEGNPKIEDTSDRERLSMCVEVEEFEEIIRSIVGLLASGRNEDKAERGRESPINDLFAALSAEELVTDTINLAQSGAKASALVSVVRDFDEKLSQNRQALETRFRYYSRLATVGTIAQMLVHEIRNRTTVIGEALRFIEDTLNSLKNQTADKHFSRSEVAVSALEGLAETFSPLASRNFSRGRRNSVLEECVQNCLALQENEIRSKRIQCWAPGSKTVVSVDPGELDAIILNLMTNALYWLEKTAKDQRYLEFEIENSADGNRATLWVHDSGPGIAEEDTEKVFWPGVTRKPNGIGMGLTVASELVAAYGGTMSTMSPGKRGGASFAFDLPLVEAPKGETRDANIVH